MKTILLTVLSAFLLALDWAALHDILKGEPDLYGEYRTLVLSGIVFGVLVLVGLGKRGEPGNIG